MHGQCDAKPKVTFQAAQCHPPWPVPYCTAWWQKAYGCKQHAL